MELPLPCDIEAEKSYLATLASPGNDDEAFLCLPMLTPDDFMVPAHRAVFNAMNELVAQRTEINSLTLNHALEGKPGAPHQIQLLELLGAEEVGRPKVLAEILRKHTLNRKIIKIGGHLQKEGYRNLEPHDIASRATDALRQLESNRKGRISGTHILERIESDEAFAEPDSCGQLIKWGLPILTEHIEASPGHIVVIGARPKCGKSALAIQVLAQSAKSGIKSLFVSLEMDTNEVESRLAANLTGEPYDHFRRKTYGEQARSLLHQNESVLDHVQVWAKYSGIPISEVEVEIRDAVRRDHIQMVVIDYFQLIEHHASKSMTEASALGANVNKLKRLAQELKIAILLLVQVNREGGKSDEPTSADLKGSGDLEQSANAIVLLWKDKNDEMHFKISDNRSGPSGFRQKVNFDGATNTWVQVERETNPGFGPTIGPAKTPKDNGTTLLAKLADRRAGLYQD